MSILRKIWRPRPELNRGTRICSPLRHHSATRPSLRILLAKWRRRVAEQNDSGNLPVQNKEEISTLLPTNLAHIARMLVSVLGSDALLSLGTDMDFQAARATMIESQVRTNDVSDLALQTAMRQVAREAFVSEHKRDFAYAEVTCPTPSGRELWKPRDFSKLAQAARALRGDRVLVIAGAGGYSAAVFAAMGCIVTIHDDVTCHYAGVEAQVGALSEPPTGPFDIIFVDGGVQTIPNSWGRSLVDGGRLCVVVLEGPTGTAQILTKSGSVLSPRIAFDAVVPKLLGFDAAPVFAF
jgi:protein-L-isoaspartate(D-aspartate) O-methyltransferase